MGLLSPRTARSLSRRSSLLLLLLAAAGFALSVGAGCGKDEGVHRTNQERAQGYVDALANALDQGDFETAEKFFSRVYTEGDHEAYRHPQLRDNVVRGLRRAQFHRDWGDRVEYRVPGSEPGSHSTFYVHLAPGAGGVGL